MSKPEDPVDLLTKFGIRVNWDYSGFSLPKVYKEILIYIISILNYLLFTTSTDLMILQQIQHR